jgi:TolB protein
LAWIAGGFIVLLFLVAALIIYMVVGRSPAEEVVTQPVSPVAGQTQPAQAVQAPNRPENVSLIYEEDFSDSFGGWDDAFDAYTTKQYGNNRYQVEITASNLVAWGLANRDAADFEVEVEARLEDGAASNSYGLLFRFQDRDNFYRFDISGDGYFLVSKFENGQWHTLVDWTASPAINQGNATNLLKVSAFGPNLTLWANGQQLTSLTDESFTHGNFGFFASAFSEPNIWVSYDNLKLWAPQGQQLTMLPTATRVSVSTPAASLSSATPPTLTSTPAGGVTTEATVEATQETLTAESPTEEPTITPTSEPTATSVPLPEYASRDQTLARGEKAVTGRIIFPVFDAARGIYDIYIAEAKNGANKTLVQAEASQPALSSDGLDLAYRSWQPDKRGLFARPLAGGEAWQVNAFFESARPQFSPADKSLMFHSRASGKEPAIYKVVNGVGEVMRRESYPIQGEAAKWSPDGQMFVYSSCQGGKCGIIRSNIDGSNPVILSDHPSDTSPEISPDGKMVVFMSKRSGNWEIYVVDIDGGEITALTSDPASDGLPTWSPDGTKIAFVSNRDGEWSIWDMDSDGGNQRHLFDIGGSMDGVVQSDIANSRSWVEENIDWTP